MKKSVDFIEVMREYENRVRDARFSNQNTDDVSVFAVLDNLKRR